MDVQSGALNITETFSVKYPVAKMIFQNKTLILVTKQQHYSSGQQMALLAGMAFVGGIVAGLLIRCLYYGIVKFFVNNMDQLASQQRPSQGTAGAPYVDDTFRVPNDEPPNYITVVTESPAHSHRTGRGKEPLELKVSADTPPPPYISIISSFGRVVRSMST